MSTISEMTTINEYLVYRLQEAKISHVFGVPGDYVLDLLDVLTKSPLKWVGNCNELNAGYAADGYARLHGLGAAIVTYGVGGFSILNAVAGAYAEQVPMIVISGAPHSARRQANAMVHHLTRDYMLQYDIFRKVTIDSAMLTNLQTAADEIDRLFINCVTGKRPVYLEIPMDMGKMPCRQPWPLNYHIDRKSDPDILRECIEDAVQMIDKAQNPVILVGVELLRFGLTKKVMRMVELLELPYATTISSKSALPELHPQFMGVYQGSMSREKVKRQVEESDCVISLGVWMTDFDTGGYTTRIDEKNMLTANTEQVTVKRHLYPRLWLGDFIDGLTEAAAPRVYLDSHPSEPFAPETDYIPIENSPLTALRFYDRLNRFLNDDMILLTEPGDAICAAQELQIEEADHFIVQAYYMSIGYCTPASLGVALARPDKRPIILTGDGAFQMTAQEVSTILRNKGNAIFILINNEGYLIERLLHEDGYYNDIQNWTYHRLPGIFGENCLGFDVNTEGDLEKALEAAESIKDKLVFVEIHLPDGQCSDALHHLGANFRKLAEGVN